MPLVSWHTNASRIAQLVIRFFGADKSVLTSICPYPIINHGN